MSTEHETYGVTVTRSVTLVDVLEGASPGPWLLSGEQNDDRPAQGENDPAPPWHVPGNWPFAVIHQYGPDTAHLGRGDGFQIAAGMQKMEDARLVRAAREMAEAIAAAIKYLDDALLDHMDWDRLAESIQTAHYRLKQAEAAITAPIPMAKPVQR